MINHAFKIMKSGRERPIQHFVTFWVQGWVRKVFDWLLVGRIGRKIFSKMPLRPLCWNSNRNSILVLWPCSGSLVGFNWLIRFQVLAHPIMFIHILHHFPWTCAVYRSLWNLPNGCGNSSCSVVGFCDCYFPMARAKDATQNICGCKDALKYWKSHLNLGRRHETKTL